jgi:putative hemolysin
MLKNLFPIKMLLTVSALAGTSLGMTGSAVAVSPNSSWSAVRLNTAGSSFVNMSASASTFCFLTGVGIEDTDTGGESARCLITRGAVVWTLEAILGASSDADVRCNAICYNN